MLDSFLSLGCHEAWAASTYHIAKGSAELGIPCLHRLRARNTMRQVSAHLGEVAQGITTELPPSLRLLFETLRLNHLT